jgi:hypothetical protein
MRQDPCVALERLDALVGTWTMEAGPPGGPPWPAPDPFPQRFRGTFEDGGATIAGRWEKAPGGSDWEVDFDLTSRRAG